MKQVTIFATKLLCLCIAMPAFAATCDVPGAYASIQLAVDDVACSEIELAAGTFSSAIVDRDVTIRGQSRASSLIQGTMTVQAASSLDAVVMSLRRLTVQSGGAGGVLLNSKKAELDGDDIDISFNSGSGVDFSPTADASVVRLRNCDIHDNQRGINAIRIDMHNCDVSFNFPLGGIHVLAGGTIIGSTISSNQHTGGTADGGGVLFDGPGGTTLTIEDSTIAGNYANSAAGTSTTSDGGGIMVREGILYLRRSSLLGNVTGRYGGGLALSDVFGGVAYVEDSVIKDNVAYSAGGGIGVLDRVEVTRSLIESNHAYYNAGFNREGLAQGGGIFVSEDGLTLTDSTVRSNSAERDAGLSPFGDYSGGGLYINTTQPVSIIGSTISGNFAETDGGGVYVRTATSMTNVTIAGNRANRDGGGIYGATTPVLTHATVVENIADEDADGIGDGGGIYNNGRFDHSLIGYNVDRSAAPQHHPDCSGGVVSAGHSFLRIADGCSAFAASSDGNQAGSAGSPLDLGIVLPITNNGGPTQTAALRSGSPAIDGGLKGCDAVTATDQRGFSRVAQNGNMNDSDGDPCDVGAFEVFSGCQAAPLLLSNITYSDTRSIQSESSLQTGAAVIVDSNANIVFEAGTVIAFGSGFQVADGGQFSAVIGLVSCN